MTIVNAKVDRLIKFYKNNPPSGSRDVAECRYAVWQAYPVGLKRALTKKNSKRMFIREFPDLNCPLGYACDKILGARRKGLNVNPCWVALDSELAPHIVLTALQDARARLKEDAAIDFSNVLAALLEEQAVKRGLTLQFSKPSKAAAKPSVVAPADESPAAPQRTVKVSAAAPLPQAGSPLPNLGEPYESLLASALRNYPTSPEEFIRYCLRDTCESGEVNQLVRHALDFVRHSISNTCSRIGIARVVENTAHVVAGFAPKPPVKAGPTVRPAPTEKPAAKTKLAVKKVPATETEPHKFAPNKHELPLHERLRIVLEPGQATIPEAIERLRARDASWVPESTDLNAYISLAFSTHKDIFVRVTRGIYQLRRHESPSAPEDLFGNIKENPFASPAVLNGTNSRSQSA